MKWTYITFGVLGVLLGLAVRDYWHYYGAGDNSGVWMIVAGTVLIIGGLLL